MNHSNNEITDDQMIAMCRDFFESQRKLEAQQKATDVRRGETIHYRYYTLATETASTFRELFAA